MVSLRCVHTEPRGKEGCECVDVYEKENMGKSPARLTCCTLLNFGIFLTLNGTFK